MSEHTLELLFKDICISLCRGKTTAMKVYTKIVAWLDGSNYGNISSSKEICLPSHCNANDYSLC